VAFGLVDTDDADEGAIKEGLRGRFWWSIRIRKTLATLLMPTTLLVMKKAVRIPSPRKDSSTISSRRKWSAAWPNGGSHPLRAGVPTPANVRPAAGIRAMHVDYGKVARS